MELDNLKPGIFKGKVMVLTGGTSKMLYQVVYDFMRLGGSAALISRRQNELDKVADKLRKETGGIAKGYALDLKKAIDVDYDRVVENILKDFDRIDILVNGAAGNFLANAEDLSLNAYKTVIEIDTIGTFLMCKHVYKKWMQKNGGSIINISATLHYLGTLMNSHAASAKAGIDALTKTLSLEWGPKGVRVNGVAPGIIEGTEGFDRLMDYKKNGVKVDVTDFQSLVPLQRYGNRKDVSNAVLFLSSDMSSYITGQTLVVDGGSFGIMPNWLQYFPDFLKTWRSKF